MKFIDGINFSDVRVMINLPSGVSIAWLFVNDKEMVGKIHGSQGDMKLLERFEFAQKQDAKKKMFEMLEENLRDNV